MAVASPLRIQPVWHFPYNVEAGVILFMHVRAFIAQTRTHTHTHRVGLRPTYREQTGAL